MKGAIAAASIALVGSFAQAQQAGGSLVFLVQPEPPTMAGYVSTSGPIGLLGPKIYDGLVDYDNDGSLGQWALKMFSQRRGSYQSIRKLGLL